MLPFLIGTPVTLLFTYRKVEKINNKDVTNNSSQGYITQCTVNINTELEKQRH